MNSVRPWTGAAGTSDSSKSRSQSARGFAAMTGAMISYSAARSWKLVMPQGAFSNRGSETNSGISRAMHSLPQKVELPQAMNSQSSAAR